MREQWPCTLWIVRHGQSAGNVARDAAEAAGHPVIDIAERDIDTPLSELGRRQARALGHWFGELPSDRHPEVVLCSPYVRARETARLMLQAAGIPRDSVRMRFDERLREKEFGILDRLTVHGIRQKYPELSEQRSHVGKFYFRPPGGESWTDVILRLRSMVDTLTRDYARRRVFVVAHQVIVLCFRYLLEGLDEERILAIDREGDVANCSVTQYRFDASIGEHGGMSLVCYNKVTPMLETGAPVTREPDVPVAPK